LAAGIAFPAINALAQPGSTDVSVSYTTPPGGVTLGQYFKCTVSVYNAGYDPSTNVVVTNLIPAGLQLIGATSSRGVCVSNANTVSCNFGILLPTQSQTMTMELKAVSLGYCTNIAVCGADNPESILTNNQAGSATLVTRAKFFGVGNTHAHYNLPLMTLMTNNQVLVVGQYGPYLGKTTDLYSVSSRTFTMPAGTMVEMHLQGTATLLTNGTVLLAGGLNPTGAKTCEVYNPVTQLFQQVGDMFVYSSGHYATPQPDGTVLFCGGNLSTDELYNPVTQTFSLAPSTQCAYNGIYLPSTGKFLYFGYGRAYLYDTNTSTSVETSGFLQPRAYHTATLLPDGQVLMAGGYGTWGTTVGPLSSAEIYDPATDTFTWTANLLENRDNHGACLLPDGTVLLTGGSVSQNDPFSLINAEVYDRNGTTDAPGIGIDDASVLEGNSGTNWMNFNVWLTAPCSFPVTVNFATGTGPTAGTTPGGVGSVDYIATNGVLTIPPGQTNATIGIPILGDLILESNETLTVWLSQPQQAWMARNMATGTILNDDTTPTISIYPVTSAVTERDSGVADLVYNVTLSAPTFDTVTVDYFTSDGTAQAGVDYVPLSGTLTYQPGETNKMLIVHAVGDLLPEPDETLTLNITNAQYASIITNQASGTILNDDGFAGALHHFNISPISGMSTQTFAIPITITARDAFGSVVTGFTNRLRLIPSTTNVIASNLDFELPTLAPWTPLTNADLPSPYELIPYDVVRDGRLSSAFRLRINGGTDGITQNIYLNGGITYTFSVDMFSAQEGIGGWIGAQASLGIGSSNGYWNIPAFDTGQSAQGRIEFLYTAPTNGIYPLSLLVSWGRPDFPDPGDLYLYADNVQIAYPQITPTVLTNGFTNGVWTGTITPLQGSSNVVLIADDTEGHKGISNPFDVLAIADQGLTVTSQIQGAPPFRTGTRMQFNLALTNRGPSAISNAAVHCQIASNIFFLAATNAQGSISNFTGGVDWIFPSLPVGSNFTCVLVYRADFPGDFTNQFTALSPLVDLNTADNFVAISNHIDPPLLTITDTNGIEAVASTNGMVFKVGLSGRSGQTISVGYLTANISASSGFDYVGTNGTITFAPGATNATITVYTIDNNLNQPNRTFNVLLANPVNAIITNGTATGTIIDDDPPPTISIADVSVVEGDSGTTNAVFKLTMNKQAIYDVTVRCSTATNTASTNDFIATTATVTFPAALTNATFTVPVLGDTVYEPTETFFVNLSLPSNATIARAQAVGTIIDDDAVPGRLDHFVWDAIPSPRYKSWLFPVTLRAVDYLGNPASNGVSSAIVTAQTVNGFLSRLQDDFEDGDSLGWSNYNSSFTATVTNFTSAQGSNSLRLSGSTASATAGFRHGISNSQPNRISFSVRVDRTNQIAGRFTAYANNLYRTTVFAFNNNGQMGILDPQQVVHGAPYQSNHWYQVDLYLNWTSRKVDCRVDGTLIATNLSFTDSSSPTSIDAVLLANQDNTVSWWDNIQVFNDNVTNVFTLTPSNFTAFATSAKSNAVTIAGAGTGTNTYLVADDGFEHVGQSGFFDLVPVKLTLQTPPSMVEGSGPTNLQVTIPVAFSQAVSVNLTSTAPTRLTMPASVVIAANQTNAGFSLSMVDDTITDWIKTAFISANGTNVDGATNSILLIDNDPGAISMSPVGAMANGVFTFSLQAPPTQNYIVYVSSNLMNWDALSNLSFANGPATISDSTSTNFTQRFYRLLPAP
jgi:uncharacterized repeat protein (TIGR01451 family)